MNKRPLFKTSSPNVPKAPESGAFPDKGNPQPDCAEVHLFSGDEDLFEWDMDDLQGEKGEKQSDAAVRQQPEVSGQVI